MENSNTKLLLSKIFPYAKWLVYSLLIFNMYLFFRDETITEGIESLAWIALLLLLEWETNYAKNKTVTPYKATLLQTARAIAYCFIIYSAYEYSTAAYIDENGVLDIYNALIWIGIVILIESELVYENNLSPTTIRVIHILKILLYASLFVIALLWQFDGEWLDFYDAALWIVCFFFIELNILKIEEHQEETL